MPIYTPLPIPAFSQEEFGKVAYHVRHGKLINFGAEKVEHQFVNCHESYEQRRQFDIARYGWSDSHESACFERTVVARLNDWGTGLSRALYE